MSTAGGPEDRPVDPQQLRRVAYHESGHAVVGYVLLGELPLECNVVALLAENRNGGTNWGDRLAWDENKAVTGDQKEREKGTSIAAMYLAGLCSTSEFWGTDPDESVHAHDDTAHARKIVAILRLELAETVPLDEPTLLAKKTLQDNAAIVHALAKSLIDRRTLSEPDLAKILAPSPT